MCERGGEDVNPDIIRRSSTHACVCVCERERQRVCVRESERERGGEDVNPDIIRRSSTHACEN